MAERRAPNKYVPPDFDPEKFGSVNAYVGQHPLRERAKRIDEGILVIRFEMPYNAWCETCGSHIGKGVRFNAEKKQIGMYYTTRIFRFQMKCPNCSGIIEVRTDPKNAEYVLSAGARRKAEDCEYREEDNVVRIPEKEEKEKLDTDPMYRLQHLETDEQKSATETPRLVALLRRNEARHGDPYRRNCELRRPFRDQRRIKSSCEETARQLGVNFEVLPTSKEDEREAHEVFTHLRKDGVGPKKDRLRRMALIKHQLSVRSSHILRGSAEHERLRERRLKAVLRREELSIPVKKEVPLGGERVERPHAVLVLPVKREEKRCLLGGYDEEDVDLPQKG